MGFSMLRCQLWGYREDVARMRMVLMDRWMRITSYIHPDWPSVSQETSDPNNGEASIEISWRAQKHGGTKKSTNGDHETSLALVDARLEGQMLFRLHCALGQQWFGYQIIEGNTQQSLMVPCCLPVLIALFPLNKLMSMEGYHTSALGCRDEHVSNPS